MIPIKAGWLSKGPDGKYYKDRNKPRKFLDYPSSSGTYSFTDREVAAWLFQAFDYRSYKDSTVLSYFPYVRHGYNCFNMLQTSISKLAPSSDIKYLQGSLQVDNLSIKLSSSLSGASEAQTISALLWRQLTLIWRYADEEFESNRNVSAIVHGSSILPVTPFGCHQWSLVNEKILSNFPYVIRDSYLRSIATRACDHILQLRTNPNLTFRESNAGIVLSAYLNDQVFFDSLVDDVLRVQGDENQIHYRRFRQKLSLLPQLMKRSLPSSNITGFQLFESVANHMFGIIHMMDSRVSLTLVSAILYDYVKFFLFMKMQIWTPFGVDKIEHDVANGPVLLRYLNILCINIKNLSI